jgi:diguanylate cyclase (GGDEF)-like protein
VDSTEFKAALAYINENSVPILKEMDAAVGLYEDALSGKISTLQQVVIGLAVAGGFAAAGGWWFVFARLARPLAKLAESAGRFGRGELDHRVDINTADEIGIVGREFNAMADERKRMEEALREQARRDTLTGILNHAAIVEELRDLLANSDNGSSHTVAMIDVDGLKAVNDTYGHQVGDAVLTTVARALSTDGAIAGRYGGDEFVAVLTGADREAAERYRDGLLHNLSATSVTDPESGASVPVVASVGLAIYPDEADTVAELIKLSDSAMYAGRRERAAGPTGRTLSQPLRDERAAAMVGELVPLLTSPGDLKDKLQLVAHRLSVGAGYDGVDFTLFAPEPGVPRSTNAFARLPAELLEAWMEEQRSGGSDPHPIRLLLERTRRPVILQDPQHDERLLEPQRAILQAAGLQSALVTPMLWQDQLVGALSVASKREAAFTPRDAQFLTAVATQVSAIVRMATLVEELQATSTRLLEAQDETVQLLAAAAEAHDQTTGLHLQSVRALTEALAQELGYSESDARELGLAAVLHDIGKIRVPDSVLASTGKLTDKEWEVLRRHTTWGVEFLDGRAGFELAITIARSHHERWGGGGYPAGLVGDAIPEAATIVAVADAFDAITQERPYKERRSVHQAVREIAAYSGKQFSPKVVNALLSLYQRDALHPTQGEDKLEAAA